MLYVSVNSVNITSYVMVDENWHNSLKAKNVIIYSNRRCAILKKTNLNWIPSKNNVGKSEPTS